MSDRRVDERGIYRLHLRSQRGDVDPLEQIAYCQRHELIGLGWGVEGDSPKTFDDYARFAGRRHGKEALISPRRLSGLKNGDLVWLRDLQGVYWLAEVAGPWRYSTRGRAVDVYNYRKARWIKIGTEERVPGKVVNSFIRGATLQRVADPPARRLTRVLFARATGLPEPAGAPTLEQVLHSLLGAYDLEDLLAVYLQAEHGYMALPASRRTDTPGYEYVLCHRDDGHRAVVQVKSGDARVDLSRLPVDSVDRAFAYAAGGGYDGPRARNLEIVEDGPLLRFMRERQRLLPPRVAEWVNYTRNGA
jgi:hypothetical protein